MPIIEDITNAIKIQIQSLLPVSLDKECEKASKIIKEFVFNKNMEVKNPIISPVTIAKAKGLVILTIGKAGVSFTVRGGSGILITHLSDGTWSAPSAVKTGGFGLGSQIGAEIIELVMVLNTEEAVKNFCENENITLGGNLSVAIGDVGRAAEASSSVKNVSAIISYGRTKGVYLGMSVEGAIIQQNNDSNIITYGKECTIEDILKGKIPKPEFANGLYDILAKCEQAIDKKKRIEASPSTKNELLFDEKATVESNEKMKNDKLEDKKNE